MSIFKSFFLFIIYLKRFFFCFVTFWYNYSLFWGSNKSNLEWWPVRSSAFVFDLDGEVPWLGVELEEGERA